MGRSVRNGSPKSNLKGSAGKRFPVGKDTSKRISKRDKQPGKEECEEECKAVLRGACDCTNCLKKIIRNAVVLLSHGWHVNIADNGAGGYGFDVTSSSDMLKRVLGFDFKPVNWTIVTEPLSPDKMKWLMCVATDSWTPHCSDEEMVSEWRKWFHLLK